MKPFFVSIVIILFTFGLSSSSKAQTEYSIHQMDSLQKLQEKPMLIFLHADWCKFCHAMENHTLADKEIRKILEKDFYYIPFNGEQKEVVTVNSQRFSYIPNGKKSGTHDLAKALGTIDGQLSYPVTAILNKQGEIIFQYSGYLSKTAFITVLEEAK